MKQISLKIVARSILLLSTIAFQFNSCSSDEEDPNRPRIEKLSPDTGSIGTEVVITGKQLFSGGGFKVKFNGVEATLVYLKDETEMTVIAPNGGSTGPVTITSGTASGTTSPTVELVGPDFTYAGEPKAKSTYYIKFKANDSWVMYQTGEPGYSTCGNCSCNAVPPEPFGNIDNAAFEVCNELNNNWVTAAQIQALKNKTLNFASGYPRPAFRYDFNKIYYATSDATQGTESKMTITDVIPEPAYAGIVPVFRIVGTFSCKVAKSDGTGIINITEGKFAIRFTED